MSVSIIADAPSRSGRMSLVRCDCGTEWIAPTRRVPHMRSCGCAMKRKPRAKKEPLPPVTSIVRAHPMMDDARLIDALVSLLAPPFGKLPYVQPVRLDWICAELGCDVWHVCRSPISIACEWTEEWIWGRAIAAGDVWGRELAACDGGRGKVAA